MAPARTSIALAVLCLLLLAGGAFANNSQDERKQAPPPLDATHTHTPKTLHKKGKVKATTAVASTRAKRKSARVLVLVRDSHGRKHKVYREVSTAEPTISTHKEKKRIAVLVRDRRGHLRKVFRTETVVVSNAKLPLERTINQRTVRESASILKQEAREKSNNVASKSQQSPQRRAMT